MPALFDLLEHEPEPGARAVLGHWLFGYIHPYPDGNGRMARFLMNAMLARVAIRGRLSRLRMEWLFGSAGSRQHRNENRAVREIHRRAGAAIDEETGNRESARVKSGQRVSARI